MPGKHNRSSPGGNGYGAGGGSGGHHMLSDECISVDGGDGAPGVVYVEVVPKGMSTALYPSRKALCCQSLIST